MAPKINLNFRLLYKSVTLALYITASLFGGAYIFYLLLSLVFFSLPVFASLFVLAMSAAVYLLYDASLFQWDTNPRIAIKMWEYEDDNDEDDDE